MPRVLRPFYTYFFPHVFTKHLRFCTKARCPRQGGKDTGQDTGQDTDKGRHSFQEEPTLQQEAAQATTLPAQEGTTPYGLLYQDHTPQA